MRPSIDDIIINELQAEHDEIVSYRFAVASGVEDHVHPVLDDNALTDAMKKVIEYYKTKVELLPISYNDVGTQLNINYDSDDAYYNAIQDGFDTKWTPGGERD
jgi:hypothetical protein